MKIMISLNEINKLKSKDLIPLECENCNKIFYREKHYILEWRKRNKRGRFCSNSCCKKFADKDKVVYCKCANCQKNIRKKKHEVENSKSGNCFCSQSCSATYNNTHKTTGCRRSKLEIWIEQQLGKIFPSIEIKYNDKKTILSELDIYIPSLSLAFELNGIFHYETIYGEKTLEKIINNDNRKFQACLERKIELCIIDTSKFGYFKESGAKEFLNIIVNIINLKIGGPYRT